MKLELEQQLIRHKLDAAYKHNQLTFFEWYESLLLLFEAYGTKYAK